MKILFTRFPLESADGGAENQTMWLADGLRAKGHEVSFLGSCPVLQRRFATQNFPVTLLDIGPPPVTKLGAISFLWRKKKMKEKRCKAYSNWLLEIGSQPQANSHKPIAIFMLSMSEKLLLTDSLYKKGVKVFWIEHDRVGPWLTRSPWLSALKKAAELVTIICVSELSRQKYIQMGFDEARVIAIPNGIPLPHPPTPSPEGGRGVLENEEPERIVKKPVHTTVLKFARSMRKEPARAEEILWDVLRDRQRGFKFRRQHPIHSRILDFYCDENKLGIEVDGPSHDDKAQAIYDREREEVLAELGIHIIRFKNEEVLEDLDEVLRRIDSYLRSPLSSGEGQGVREFKDFHVGCVSRLSREKGVDVLLQAIVGVPEVTLTIVGKGPEEHYLHNLIAEDTRRIGVQRVRVVPHVEDLGSFYASLDAFVLPSSDNDPFGLVAAEAMSYGTATIVTDACGIAGSLNADTEVLVAKAGSPASLGAHLRRLLDPALRSTLGQSGKQAVMSRLTVAKMIEEYEKLLMS